MPPGVRRTSTAAAGWALAIFFVLEFLLFDQVGARHYTWVYPRWNDQIQYLTECYLGYEYARLHGFFAGVWSTLVNPAAQGTLHDLWALLIFKCAGASRSAALSLNIIFLIIWQAGLFFAARRTLRSTAMGWLAIGLTLCLRSPWADAPGSAWDFRLDWMAACVMGATGTAAIFAIPFESFSKALVFGLAVAWLLLTRFLSGTYLLVIYFILFATLLKGPQKGRRAINLLSSGLLAAAIAGPIFWLNRDWVYTYYLIGHYVGPESALRASHMGVIDSAIWLARCLSDEHLGSSYTSLLIIAGGALLLLLAVLSLLKRGSRDNRPSTEAPRMKTSVWWVAGGAFLFAPFLVLTLHIQKSSVVADIFLGGTVMLSVAVFAALLQALGKRLSAVRAVQVRRLTAAAIFAFGSFKYVGAMTANPHSADFVASARTVARVADEIFDRSRAAGLVSPKVGVDRITDCFDAQVLRVICYERKKVWVPFLMMLPTGIAEDDEANLRERLSQCDFMFLTQESPRGTWPYDLQMERLRPDLTRWCDENLKPAELVDAFGTKMVLYQRKEIP